MKKLIFALLCALYTFTTTNAQTTQEVEVSEVDGTHVNGMFQYSIEYTTTEKYVGTRYIVFAVSLVDSDGHILGTSPMAGPVIKHDKLAGLFEAAFPFAAGTSGYLITTYYKDVPEEEWTTVVDPNGETYKSRSMENDPEWTLVSIKFYEF